MLVAESFHLGVNIYRFPWLPSEPETAQQLQDRHNPVSDTYATSTPPWLEAVNTLTPARTPRLHWKVVTRCIVRLGLSSAITLSSWHNGISPSEMQINPPKAIIMWLPMRRVITSVTHAILSSCGMHLSMNNCIYRVPPERSVGERYDNKYQYITACC